MFRFFSSLSLCVSCKSFIFTHDINLSTCHQIETFNLKVTWGYIATKNSAMQRKTRRFEMKKKTKSKCITSCLGLSYRWRSGDEGEHCSRIVSSNIIIRKANHVDDINICAALKKFDIFLFYLFCVEEFFDSVLFIWSHSRHYAANKNKCQGNQTRHTHTECVCVCMLSRRRIIIWESFRFKAHQYLAYKVFSMYKSLIPFLVAFLLPSFYRWKWKLLFDFDGYIGTVDEIKCSYDWQ